MINLPYVPYIIFFSILVVGSILGYKRGWRPSLYFLGLSFLSIIVSYFLSMIFFDFIADLFEKHIYNNKGDPTYDWSDMLIVSSEIIYIIGVSLLFVPVTTILWLISFSFYKKLLNKNFPSEYKKISSNQRLVHTPNYKKNKLTGLAIGSLNSLIVASIVTSAVATFFISSTNFNILFSITDTLSNIISAGNIGSPLAYQYLVDFLPYTKDEELMSAISSLVRSNEQNPIKQKQIEKLNDEEHREALKNILSTPESTKALLDTIDQKNDKPQWNPFDAVSSLVARTPSLTPLDSLDLNLSTNERTNLVDWIITSTIIDFEKTSPYIDWQDSKTKRVEMQEELKTRTTGRDSILSDIKKSVSVYNSLILDLEKYIIEHNQKLNLIPRMISDRDVKQVIEVSERATRDSLEGIMDDKKQIMDDSSSDYHSAVDANESDPEEIQKLKDKYNEDTDKYNVAKANYDKQYSIWDNANTAYNSTSSLLITTQDRVDQLNHTLIPSTESSINFNYSTIDELHQDLSNIEFSQVRISDIDSRFTSLVSLSGGDNSYWAITKPSITKTTYTQDASTESDSIPYQENIVEVALEDEAALLAIRKEKYTTFKDLIEHHKESWSNVLKS